MTSAPVRGSYAALALVCSPSVLLLLLYNMFK